MADIVMTNVQNVDLHVTSVVDEAGQPVVGSTIAWSADPGGYVILTPSVDGLSCNFESNGLLTAPAPGGTINLIATATLLGVGVGSGSKSLQVVNSPVFTVTLSNDAPVNN